RLDVAGGTHRPLPGVTFHGAVPGERVAALMDAADAALITSLGFDNQPMVALEAFAHGRPVIVSDPVLGGEFGDAALLTPTPILRLDVAGGTHRPLPGVTFHGAVPGERVAALMDAADAALITSLGFDNQPMVALEAFAHGRPVIVSDPVLGGEFGDAALLTPT